MYSIFNLQIQRTSFLFFFLYADFLPTAFDFEITFSQRMFLFFYNIVLILCIIHKCFFVCRKPAV